MAAIVNLMIDCYPSSDSKNDASFCSSELTSVSPQRETGCLLSRAKKSYRFFRPVNILR